MKILVDADACPVKKMIIEIARINNLEVIMAFDSAHIYEDDYSTVYILDKGADSVDYFLISLTQKNDIIVTGDYGLAAMAIAKGSKAITPNGLIFTEDNINSLLNSRYKSAKLRRSGIRVKGPSKRLTKNDTDFTNKLTELINSVK